MNDELFVRIKQRRGVSTKSYVIREPFDVDKAILAECAEAHRVYGHPVSLQRLSALLSRSAIKVGASFPGAIDRLVEGHKVLLFRPGNGAKVVFARALVEELTFVLRMEAADAEIPDEQVDMWIETKIGDALTKVANDVVSIRTPRRARVPQVSLNAIGAAYPSVTPKPFVPSGPRTYKSAFMRPAELVAESPESVAQGETNTGSDKPAE